jgi:hypothetical protein
MVTTAATAICGHTSSAGCGSPRLAWLMLEALRRLRYGARIRRACCSENSGRKRAARLEIRIRRRQNLASLPNIEDPRTPTLKQYGNKPQQGVISEGVRNAG